MASAYSTPHDFGQYIPQLPLDVIAAGLQYKQGKYDANREKLQVYVNQLANIDLAKVEDQEHLYNNLQFLKSQVEKAGMGDLSQAGVAEQIAQYIGYAADDKVVAGMAGTKVLRNIQKTAQEAFDKDPKTYSDTNYSYSMEGINNWLNDGKVGSSWKNYTNVTQYIPYTDVIEAGQKVLDKLDPDIKIVQVDNGQFIYTQKNEVITSQKIISTLDGILLQDPNVRQQMSINSWATFEKMEDPQLSQLALTQKRGEIQQYKSWIAGLQHKKNLDDSMPDEVYDEQIKELQQRISLAEKNTSPQNWENYFSQNRKELAFDLYKDNLYNGFQTMYAKNNVVESDEGKYRLEMFKAQLKGEEDRAKNQAEIAKAYETNPDLAETLAGIYKEQEFYDGMVLARTVLANMPADTEKKSLFALETVQGTIQTLTEQLSAQEEFYIDDYGQTFVTDENGNRTINLSTDQLRTQLEQLKIEGDPAKARQLEQIVLAREQKEFLEERLKEAEQVVKDDLIERINRGELITVGEGIEFELPSGQTINIESGSQLKRTKGGRIMKLPPPQPQVSEYPILISGNVKPVDVTNILDGLMVEYIKQSPNRVNNLLNEQLQPLVDNAAPQKLDLTLQGNEQYIEEVYSMIPPAERAKLPKEFNSLTTLKAHLKSAAEKSMPIRFTVENIGTGGMELNYGDKRNIPLDADALPNSYLNRLQERQKAETSRQVLLRANDTHYLSQSNKMQGQPVKKTLPNKVFELEDYKIVINSHIEYRKKGSVEKIELVLTPKIVHNTDSSLSKKLQVLKKELQSSVQVESVLNSPYLLEGIAAQINMQ